MTQVSTTTPDPTEPPPDATGPPPDAIGPPPVYVPSAAIIGLIVIFSILAIASFVGLVYAWPAPIHLPVDPNKDVSWAVAGTRIANGAEARMLMTIACAGALGSMLYVLRSLVWYIGNRVLAWS